ncbi:MAG: 2-hydroxychromene-2-carboxylate isomerase [Alphaproteobacteria bacterium]|nr:2-hydroxychromene-2-carboxylate isomerase [Alphaproteobacteria bacterium]
MVLEFYFDLASPPSYIAHERLPGIVERTGAALILKPVLAGGIFKLSGNSPPVAVPAKRTYMMQVELPRLAREHGIVLNFDPGAPFDPLPLMRGAMVAAQLDRLGEYTGALFRAMWRDARDLSDPAVAADVLNAAGFDAEMIGARSGAQSIKTQLIEATEAAVDRGLFGVPTFFIGSEMFFGQDRLSSIEAALDAGISLQ